MHSPAATTLPPRLHGPPSSQHLSGFYQQQQQQHRQQLQTAYETRTSTAGYLNKARNPGSIRWNANGTSTSAERRLPFVHRFRPVAPNSGNNPPFEQQQQQQQEKAAAMYQSNPVGALQERFQSRGMAPDYKVIESGGAPHCPVFTFEVRVGDAAAQGSGKTKQQAKQTCARSMLNILDGRRAEDAGDDGTDEKPSSDAPAAKAPHADNTIGTLQEHCVNEGLPMPVYVVTKIDGQPREGVFGMEVRVGSLSASAEGRSKKDAKREAARKMCEKFEDAKPETYETLKSADDKEEAEEVKVKHVETLTAEQSAEIRSFYGKLDAKKVRLVDLHKGPVSRPDGSYVKTLADLAQEQGFTVTFVDVDEASEEGDVQCLVQLSTMPVAVCYGLGKDLEGANSNAAKSALHYLKIMTKNSIGATGKEAHAAAAASDDAADVADQQKNGN